MGHRALVAVRRPDGRYEAYRSQRGGERPDRLSRLVARGEAPPGLAASDPVLSGAAPETLLAFLDPREYEALVVVGRATETYLVCWLGIETSGPTRDPATATFVREAAALVPWTNPASARRIRRFCRTAKDVLGDAVDAGLLSAAAATAYLGARLARHPDVPDGTLWLPPGGESGA